MVQNARLGHLGTAVEAHFSVVREEDFDTVVIEQIALGFGLSGHDIRVVNLEQKVQFLGVIAERHARAVGRRVVVCAGQRRELALATPILGRAVNSHRSARNVDVGCAM